MLPFPPERDPSRPPTPPEPCTEGGGGMTFDPPLPERAVPRPPPIPDIDGGGGTTLAATDDSERPPPAPPSSVEGGGGTTEGLPPANVPTCPPPVPETEGGGGTTPEPFPEEESPNKFSSLRTQVCNVGGGAITAAFGEMEACPADTPPTSGGGAIADVCRDAPGRPLPLTSGGGATTDVTPAGAPAVRWVASKGTLGGTGADEPMFGRAIAVFRSGGTTSAPGRRASRATSSGR